MWRRLLWWSSDRPAILPWAVLLSLLLLTLGTEVRLAISSTVVRFVYAPFFALRHRIEAGAEVFEQNLRLTEELTALQITHQRLTEAASENERLRSLLGFAPPWDGALIPAEVIGSVSPGTGTLWIGAGSDRNVETNWPVVTRDGLLGRVVEVSPKVSRVRTLWDRLLRVAAHDQRSRVGGVVSWEEGNSLEMNYVQRRADVLPGDTIISSGWGSVFPKGLVIGTVAGVDSSGGGDFLRIHVTPTIRPSRLEEVFVLEPLMLDSTDILRDGSQ